MMWTVILVAFAISATVFAYSRCRQANQLIERILTEELGAPTSEPALRPVLRPVASHASRTFRPQVPLQRPAA